jgi:hypothetical protein
LVGRNEIIIDDVDVDVDVEVEIKKHLPEIVRFLTERRRGEEERTFHTKRQRDVNEEFV